MRDVKVKDVQEYVRFLLSDGRDDSRGGAKAFQLLFKFFKKQISDQKDSWALREYDPLFQEVLRILADPNLRSSVDFEKEPLARLTGDFLEKYFFETCVCTRPPDPNLAYWYSALIATNNHKLFSLVPQLRGEPSIRLQEIDRAIKRLRDEIVSRMNGLPWQGKLFSEMVDFIPRGSVPECANAMLFLMAKRGDFDKLVLLDKDVSEAAIPEALGK